MLEKKKLISVKLWFISPLHNEDLYSNVYGVSKILFINIKRVWLGSYFLSKCVIFILVVFINFLVWWRKFRKPHVDLCKNQHVYITEKNWLWFKKEVIPIRNHNHNQILLFPCFLREYMVSLKLKLFFSSLQN